MAAHLDSSRPAPLKLRRASFASASPPFTYSPPYSPGLRHPKLVRASVCHTSLIGPASLKLRRASFASSSPPFIHSPPHSPGLRHPKLVRAKDGGRGGIRTPGTFRFARFQGWSNRPLCHPSETSLTPQPRPRREKRKNTDAQLRVNSVEARALQPAFSTSPGSCPDAPRCAPGCRRAP